MFTSYIRFCVVLFFVSCEAKNIFSKLWNRDATWAKEQWMDLNEKGEPRSEELCEGTFESQKIKTLRKYGGMFGGLVGAAGTTAAVAAAVAGTGGAALVAAPAAISGISAIATGNGLQHSTVSTRYIFKRVTIDGKERVLVSVTTNGTTKPQYGYLKSIIIERADEDQDVSENRFDTRYRATFKMKNLTARGRLCDRYVYYKDTKGNVRTEFLDIISKLNEVVEGNVNMVNAMNAEKLENDTYEAEIKTFELENKSEIKRLNGKLQRQRAKAYDAEQRLKKEIKTLRRKNKNTLKENRLLREQLNKRFGQ